MFRLEYITKTKPRSNFCLTRIKCASFEKIILLVWIKLRNCSVSYRPSIFIIWINCKGWKNLLFYQQEVQGLTCSFAHNFINYMPNIWIIHA